MSANEPWALASFRLHVKVPPSSSLQAKLTHTASSAGDEIWTYTSRNDQDQTLAEQIEEIDNFLAGAMSDLKETKDAEVDVRVSWAPVEPQDGVVFPRAFLANLSQLSADLFVDTYVET